MRSGEKALSTNSIRNFAIFALIISFAAGWMPGEKRVRAREMGIQVGVLEPGKWNAITDVDGVMVGHVTVDSGPGIRTGVTAILPHNSNVFLQKVPAAIYIGNGFGKLMGISQVEELGNLETPILLTATLNVPRVADALIDYMLELPGMESVRSINPVVGETNDGYLNNIRERAVSRQHVFEAIQKAKSGPVEEGSVGAGRGTVCYGFKGGIGTSSRKLPEQLNSYTVGVLVQSNFGGILEINGAPVGKQLGRYYLKNLASSDSSGDGSCMMIVATDAPLTARNLKRLAKRAMLGFGATGTPSTNGSGDYVIAFSTSNSSVLENEQMSPLFQAVKEATQEAIYNSLFMAETVEGAQGHKVEAIPLDEVSRILKKYGVIP